MIDAHALARLEDDGCPHTGDVVAPDSPFLDSCPPPHGPPDRGAGHAPARPRREPPVPGGRERGAGWRWPRTGPGADSRPSAHSILE